MACVFVKTLPRTTNLPDEDLLALGDDEANARARAVGRLLERVLHVDERVALLLVASATRRRASSIFTVLTHEPSFTSAAVAELGRRERVHAA